MSNDNRISIPGPGLASLLTVLFVGLKLTGHLSWSWWWVWSPLWLSAGLVFTVLVAAILVMAIAKD